MDVVQDALCLGPLGRDRRWFGRDRTGSQPGDRKGENHECCLSYTGATRRYPHHFRQAHREGPVRHGSTTLAPVADTGNREPGHKRAKIRAKRLQTDAAPRGSRRLDGGSERAEVPALPVPERAKVVRSARFVAGAKSPEHLPSGRVRGIPALPGLSRGRSGASAGRRRAPAAPGGAGRPGAGGSRPALRPRKPPVTGPQRPRAPRRAGRSAHPQGANRAPGVARRTEDASRVPAPPRGAAPDTSTNMASRTRSRSSSARPRWTRRSNGLETARQTARASEMVLEQSRAAKRQITPVRARLAVQVRQAQTARDRVAATAAGLEQARSERTVLHRIAPARATADRRADRPARGAGARPPPRRPGRRNSRRPRSPRPRPTRPPPRSQRTRRPPTPPRPSRRLRPPNRSRRTRPDAHGAPAGPGTPGHVHDRLRDRLLPARDDGDRPPGRPGHRRHRPERHPARARG